MKENIIIILLILNLFVMACILFRLTTSRAASFDNGKAIADILNETRDKVTQALATVQVINIENAGISKEVKRIGKAIAPKGKVAAKKTTRKR